MYTNITDCLAGGGAYAAYLRVRLVGGSVITKPATVAEKDFTDGSFVSFSATLTASELNGRTVDRVGLTDCVGGNELIGGAAVSLTDSGGLERILTFTLALAKPDGWLGSEKLFDMLAGITPFTADFSARTDGGETVAVTPVFADGGVSFAASFANEFSKLTLVCGGEDALLISAPPREVTETVAPGRNDDYLAATPNARALVAVTLNGAATDAVGIVVPTAVGGEKKLPCVHSGRMTAFGDFLALTETNNIRVYGAGFKLLASRSGKGITDCSVTDSGAFAFADGERIRVCRGCADVCEIPVAATSVVLIEKNGRLRLHYLAGGRLVGADVTDGAAAQVYDVPSDCIAIVDRGECVLGIAPKDSRFYAPDGALKSSYSMSEGTITAVTGKSRGLIMIGTDRRSWLVMPSYQTGIEGDGKALSGRLMLTEVNGKTRVTRLGWPADPIVCEVAADDMAYADRLYYRRGTSVFCREPLATELRITGIEPVEPVEATLSADGVVAGNVTVTVGINIV